MKGQIKVKVSLTADKSLGYGHLVICCGKRQQVHVNELEESDWWECMYCERPLLLKTAKGLFRVGENITI